MSFHFFLRQQLQMHPTMQPQDLVKLCYQAAYGAEHLLSDPNAAEHALADEYRSICCRDEPLYEAISDDFGRVNLGAWKAKELPLPWLFAMFADSSHTAPNVDFQFEENLRQAEDLLCKNSAPFSLSEWRAYLDGYRQDGSGAVHHSELYRRTEQPAYRVVSAVFQTVLPILEKAAQILHKKPICIIVIDGRAGAGKTTLAHTLRSILHAEIIEMDHFFLPAELRNPQRYEQPGGNIHHERFLAEVSPHLSHNSDFSYRVFDCGTMSYRGERRISKGSIRIIEGSYSCHPLLADHADIRVFMDVSPQEQLNRIKKRNGEERCSVFRDRWIPMEERYFSTFGIRENCDFLINTTTQI